MDSNPSGSSRVRGDEGDPVSASQDTASKGVVGTENQLSSSVEGSRPPEKKPQHPPPRPTNPSSSHQKASQSVVHSSHSSGSTDLQPSVFGRMGSSVAGMTVPIRLDALSYLLNNAIIGAYKMLPQIPYYGGSCSTSICQSPCSYQAGFGPYSSCMSQTPCSFPCPNQASFYQGGYFPYASQQGQQMRLPQTSSFTQCMGSAPLGQNNTLFQGCITQSGMNVNSNGLSSGQHNSNTFQQEFTRSNDKLSNVTNNSEHSNSGLTQPEGSNCSQRLLNLANNTVSSEGDNYTSQRQNSFGRGGDRDGDGWSGRRRRDFGRGGGGGEFGTRSWQNNSRNQDRDNKYGDRRESFSQRRGQDSPDKSQGWGQSSKRGRWSTGRGRGGESRDTWQQRSTFEDSSEFNDRSTTENQMSSFGGTNLADEKDDWETDYPEKCTKSTDSVDQNPTKVNTCLDSLLSANFGETKPVISVEKASSENRESPTSTSLINDEKDVISKEDKDLTTKPDPSGVEILNLTAIGSIVNASSPSFMGTHLADGESPSSTSLINIEKDVISKEDKDPTTKPDPSGVEILNLSATDNIVNASSPSIMGTHVAGGESDGYVIIGASADEAGTDTYKIVLSVEDGNNNEVVLELVDVTET